MYNILYNMNMYTVLQSKVLECKYLEGHTKSVLLIKIFHYQYLT